MLKYGLRYGDLWCAMCQQSYNRKRLKMVVVAMGYWIRCLRAQSYELFSTLGSLSGDAG